MSITSSFRNKREADPDCDVCDGEGEYEMMNQASDGEPHYYMQACECTIR